MKGLSHRLIDCAREMAREAGARAILIYADACKNIERIKTESDGVDVILVTKDEDKLPKAFREAGKVIAIPDLNLTRAGQMKIAITKGIAGGLLKKGDKAVCITGIAKFGYLDSVTIIDVGREYEILAAEHISDIFEGICPEVFEAVLNIALELAAQGREGRSVGTIFIIGDHENVLRFSRQMIINPFMGYKEEERNVLDPGLKDTVKEFSSLDGAFVIKDNGVMMTAGTHLNAAIEDGDFPNGLGGRHIAAAGITSVTNAIAVVVSESTGTVRVFKNGKVFVGIEKPVE